MFEGFNMRKKHSPRFKLQFKLHTISASVVLGTVERNQLLKKTPAAFYQEGMVQHFSFQEEVGLGFMRTQPSRSMIAHICTQMSL